MKITEKEIAEQLKDEAHFLITQKDGANNEEIESLRRLPLSVMRSELGIASKQDWEVINTITFNEEGITEFIIDRDKDGNAFELTDMLISTDTPQVFFGGTASAWIKPQLTINNKVVTLTIGVWNEDDFIWRAVATVINNRVWFGFTKTTENNIGNYGLGLPMIPMQDVNGVLLNDSSITAVGVNISNPGPVFFAAGLTMTLYGRRK